MPQQNLPTRMITKFVREGDFAAEVDVALVEDRDNPGWGPYLSPKDARRLDEVRKALRKKDTAAAARFARVYALTPIAAE